MQSVTHAEVRQLLAAIDVRSAFGPRDYFLIVFDVNTGLRVHELTGLTVSDVAQGGIPRPLLVVRSDIAKGSKSRIVPLNALAQKAVARLLAFNAARGFSRAPGAPLFVTRKHTRLSDRAVQRMMQMLRIKAGLDIQATPHSLRHGFASHLAEKTGNIRVVQKLLGHKRLETASVYTHTTRQQLQAAVDAMVSP